MEVNAWLPESAGLLGARADAFVRHDASAAFELRTFDDFGAVGEYGIRDACPVADTGVGGDDAPLHGRAFADARFLPDHARSDRCAGTDDRLVADDARAGDTGAGADVRALADVDASADLRAGGDLRPVEDD